MSIIDKQHISFAHETLDQCRHISLRYFRAEHNRQLKHDMTPVTQADKQCEQFIREQIMQQFPMHGIIGEEQAAHQSDAHWQWIIDPIDGTKSFAAGNPIFGTLLCLLFEGKPLLGIVDMPALNERYVGVSGQASKAYRGQKEFICKPNQTTDLSQARVFATTPDMFDDTQQNAFSQLSRHCQYRGFGGDCYNYALLASGHIEIVCEAQMKHFDYLPLCPIIEGASGRISDWLGAPLTLTSNGTVLASANATLHAKALAELQAASM